MDKQTRRQQSADYKRQEVQSGIYQIHCTATDTRWAGIALNLSAIRNRLWFGLRQGSHPHRQLQQAWAAHGADAFQWEPILALEEDPERLDFERDRLLRDALEQHCLQSGATPLR